jgi:hypothetical protein
MKWDEEDRERGPKLSVAPQQNDQIKVLSDEKSLVFPRKP